jgi:two-component system KDP operon response regulator KdpE
MWNEDPQLLLIDDDKRLTDAIALYLRRSGYTISVAHDGPSGLSSFHDAQPDLIILDVMMPGMDGWEVCRRLRQSSDVPIIMLTARADETDRVIGLRLGADDYVGKPFSLKELEARIEAVLRRSARPAGAVGEAGPLHDDGFLRIDKVGMQVKREGEPLDLTATERRLLFALAEQPRQILSADAILRRVWGPEYVGQSDYVKLYIWRLRQKVEPNPSQPVYIRTERGLGYRFAPPADAPEAVGEDGSGSGS